MLVRRAACPQCTPRQSRSPASATTVVIARVSSTMRRRKRRTSKHKGGGVTRLTLHASPMIEAAEAFSPAFATITTRSALATSSIRFLVRPARSLSQRRSSRPPSAVAERRRREEGCAVPCTFRQRLHHALARSVERDHLDGPRLGVWRVDAVPRFGGAVTWADLDCMAVAAEPSRARDRSAPPAPPWPRPYRAGPAAASPPPSAPAGARGSIPGGVTPFSIAFTARNRRCRAMMMPLSVETRFSLCGLRSVPCSLATTRPASRCR